MTITDMGILLSLDGDQKLYRQLRNGYETCSVMDIPHTIEAWREQHRTARKRADRCERRGYHAHSLEHVGGEDWTRINLSLDNRQGRPMAQAYRERLPVSPLDTFVDGRHAVRATGVTRDGILVGYLVMHRAGDLALVSQILGHGDHLHHEVMYLLFQTALEREIDHGPGWVVYNRADSGTDGLRFFKDRLGFTATRVEWLP